MKLKNVLLAAGVLVLASALAALVFLPKNSSPVPSHQLSSASERMDLISIAAQIDPASASMQVKQSMTLENRTGQNQRSVVFRTLPNAFQSLSTSPCADENDRKHFYPQGLSYGSLSVSGITVNGEEVPSSYSDAAKTVLCIKLNEDWKAGKSLTVEMEYTVNIPKTAWYFGTNQDVIALGDMFATPAFWNGTDWRTDELMRWGNVVSGDCANFDVTLTVPAGWKPIVGASMESTVQNGTIEYHFRQYAVRSVAVVIRKNTATASMVYNGVLLTADAANASQANTLLNELKNAVECYEKHFGRYPYPQLSIVETGMYEEGMAFSSLIMISSDLVQQGGSELEYAVAHLTAHQWWGLTVATDSYNDAWQSEALCEYSLLLYLQDRYGAAARKDYERIRIETAMQTTAAGVTPGSPLDAFSSLTEYRRIVYNRGAELFLVLQPLCEGKLEQALSSYYETYRFGFATRENFTECVSHVSGKDIRPIMLDYLDTLY